MNRQAALRLHSQQFRLLRRDRVAGADRCRPRSPRHRCRSRRGRAGAAAPAGWRGRAAAGIRIDIDGGAADDAFHDLQPGVADRQRLVERDRIRARPASPRHRGWRGSEGDGPAAPTMFSMARRLARLMIETTLRATSEKLWPRLERIFGGPLIWPAKVAGEEFLDAARPSAFRDRPGLRSGRRRIVRTWLASSKWVRSAGQPFVPHQHQEMRLRQPFRRGRVEPATARSRWRSGGRQ